MNEILFLARYTPFWGIPLMLIAGEFAYVSWIRKKKKWLMLCTVLTLFSLACLVFYYWAGGPEKTVKLLMDFYNFYFN